jgi:hypothetical protein
LDGVRVLDGRERGVRVCGALVRDVYAREWAVRQQRYDTRVRCSTDTGQLSNRTSTRVDRLEPEPRPSAGTGGPKSLEHRVLLTCAARSARFVGGTPTSKVRPPRSRPPPSRELVVVLARSTLLRSTEQDPYYDRERQRPLGHGHCCLLEEGAVLDEGMKRTRKESGNEPPRHAPECG